MGEMGSGVGLRLSSEMLCFSPTLLFHARLCNRFLASNPMYTTVIVGGHSIYH